MFSPIYKGKDKKFHVVCYYYIVAVNFDKDTFQDYSLIENNLLIYTIQKGNNRFFVESIFDSCNNKISDNPEVYSWDCNLAYWGVYDRQRFKEKRERAKKK